MKKLFFLPAFFSSLAMIAQDKLEISKGTTVTSNDAIIVLEDMNLVSESGFSCRTGSTILITGNKTTSITGKRFSVENLVLDKKNAAMLSLDADMDISGSLQFVNGRIDLRHHVIDLGNTGKLLNENETSHVFSTGNGYIESRQWLDHPVAVNPGNLGVIITSASTPGTTIVRRGHRSQLNDANGSRSLLRYYDIMPSNNSNLNASVKFHYLDNELRQLNESEIVMLKDEHNKWLPVGYDSRNALENFLEKKAIDRFSRITLSTTMDKPESISIAGSINVKEKCTAWPNPVIRYTNVSISAGRAGSSRLAIYNAQGALVKLIDRNLSVGVNQVAIDMNSLPQGSYLLKVSWANRSESIKLNKM